MRTSDITRTENELREYLRERTLSAQREAITATDPLVVVSAGAGTGKTWTLAWRFAWMILTGRAGVSEILTLTYTEKAATEMQGRIRSLLQQLREELGDDERLEKLLSNALIHLEEAYISTIHSFSSRVMKECGLALERDQDSRLASPPEEFSFWQEVGAALDRMDLHWFSMRLSDGGAARAAALFGRKEFVDVINTFRTDGIIDLSRRLAGISASRGKSPEFLWKWSENIEDNDEIVRGDLERLYIPMIEDEWNLWFCDGGVLSAITGQIVEGRTKLARNLADLKKRWGGALPEADDLFRFVQDLLEAIKGARGGLSSEIAALLPEGSVSDYRKARSNYAVVGSLILGSMDGREVVLRRILLAAAAMCWEVWEEYKRRHGLISFDDMIIEAGRALNGNRSYASRFRTVMVDEFQDTNELQDELLKAICREGCSLFVVGDLKQSIYRFRHADLTLFGRYIERARNASDGEGRYINLDISFRSHDGVLEYVNGLFGDIWRRGLGAKLPHPYERLRSPAEAPEGIPWYRERQGTEVEPVELLLEYRRGRKKGIDEGDSITDVRERLASRLAARLLDIHRAGNRIWDKDEERLREVRWSDMAILVPTRNQYPALEDVLVNRFGLPLYFEKSTSYFARSEIQDSVSLLECLCDPSDEVSLLSFISSPFSGMSLEEVDFLAGLRFEEGHESLMEDLKRLHPRLGDRLKSWRLLGSVEGPSAVLTELLSDASNLQAFAPWKRRGVAANLRKAVDISREYERTMGVDLRGCTEYLRRAVRDELKLEEAESLGMREDVIRVMTAHAAKGLEFPVVALLGCEYMKKGGERGTSIFPSRAFGVVASRYPEPWLRERREAEVPESGKIDRLLQEMEEREEWQRLFYVAATRARDSLLICGIVGTRASGERSVPKGSWLSMVADHEGSLEKLPGPQEDRPQARGRSSREEARTLLGRVVSPASDGGVFLDRMSATAYSLFRYCPYAYRLKHRQGMDIRWESQEGGGSAGGADLGSLAHWFLSRWNFDRKGLDGLLGAAPADHVEIANLLPADLRSQWRKKGMPDLLRNWFEKFAGLPLAVDMRKAAEAGNLRREVPFRIALSGGPLLVGAMDVIWEDARGLHIRDYKITEMAGAPDELYRRQLLFYGMAAARDRGDVPMDIALYHLRESIEGAPLDLRGISWKDVEEDVMDVAESAVEGPFNAERSKCSTCPFRRSCTSSRGNPA